MKKYLTETEAASAFPIGDKAFDVKTVVLPADAPGSEPCYVFLDIDGVLNAESDYVSPKGKRIRGPMCGCYCGIGSPHLRELAKLVKATGAETILISSWKDLAEHDPCKIYMKRRFLRFGIRIAGNTSEDETAIGSFDFRGAAIKRWLIRNEASPKFARFVILDDDPFDYRAEKLTGHWVRTSFHGHGFGPDEEKEAERMLRESPND